MGRQTGEYRSWIKLSSGIGVGMHKLTVTVLLPRVGDSLVRAILLKQKSVTPYRPGLGVATSTHGTSALRCQQPSAAL